MKYKFMILMLMGVISSAAMAKSEVCHNMPLPGKERIVRVHYFEWSKIYTLDFQSEVGEKNYVADYVVDRQVGQTLVLTKRNDFSSDATVLPETVALSIQANQPNNYITLSSDGLFAEPVIFQKGNCRDPDAPKVPACPFRPHCL